MRIGGFTSPLFVFIGCACDLAQRFETSRVLFQFIFSHSFYSYYLDSLCLYQYTAQIGNVPCKVGGLQ